MTTKTNVKNLRQYKSTFFTVGKVLAFASSTKLVREKLRVCLQISNKSQDNALRYR